jgi:branched-chain amino acid transport system ATP-binding protein
MSALLDIRNLHAAYGKSRVLHGVDLRLQEGEIISLLGRNGTGRSTLLKTIMGLVPPASGSVMLAGRELAGRAPHEVARAGIGWVPEERLVFEALTVEENLHIGMKAGVAGEIGGTQWTVAQMYAYFPRLQERRTTRAGNLSGGEQQMLTLCRSLLGNPRVLLVDEPTEGLAPKIVEHLVAVIGDIHRRGVAVLLVEQKMTIAMRLAQRCLIMGKGRIVFDGTPEALRQDDALRRTWLEVA